MLYESDSKLLIVAANSGTAEEPRPVEIARVISSQQERTVKVIFSPRIALSEFHSGLILSTTLAQDLAEALGRAASLIHH